jgi:hypothetical protein
MRRSNGVQGWKGTKSRKSQTGTKGVGTENMMQRTEFWYLWSPKKQQKQTQFLFQHRKREAKRFTHLFVVICHVDLERKKIDINWIWGTRREK